ncbi:hypothetical protein EJ03DRAFT_119762 [Teratosphaeria nubilosa]|uniref:Uncharacterized protein n=1 Tax=Teratosphaeria nubilosa TaxID=161662 RepID=A0A6G1L691_9PEZI|nr:hypothetical protein EJ03DRAFT_119762 [Teratosphaeria nubilosa]
MPGGGCIGGPCGGMPGGGCIGPCVSGRGGPGGGPGILFIGGVGGAGIGGCGGGGKFAGGTSGRRGTGVAGALDATLEVTLGVAALTGVLGEKGGLYCRQPNRLLERISPDHDTDLQAVLRITTIIRVLSNPFRLLHRLLRITTTALAHDPRHGLEPCLHRLREALMKIGLKPIHLLLRGW